MDVIVTHETKLQQQQLNLERKGQRKELDRLRREEKRSKTLAKKKKVNIFNRFERFETKENNLRRKNGGFKKRPWEVRKYSSSKDKPLSERAQQRQEEKDWFSMQLVLSKFGPQFPKKERQRVNIHRDKRGPWRYPSVQIASARAHGWTMLDGVASLRNTSPGQLDTWGPALQVYFIFLRALALAYLVASFMSLPMIGMNLAGSGLDGRFGTIYDISRTSLGNIGTAKVSADRLNMSFCEELRENATLLGWVTRDVTTSELNDAFSLSASSLDGGTHDTSRHDAEQRLLDACVGPYVETIFFGRTPLWEALRSYSILYCSITIVIFVSMTWFLHKERSMRRLRWLGSLNASEYSVFVTGFPKATRPPDNEIRKRIAEHMSKLYDLSKGWHLVNATGLSHRTPYQTPRDVPGRKRKLTRANIEPMGAFRPHGRSVAETDRELFTQKWVAGVQCVYNNDASFRNILKTTALYKKRHYLRMVMWKRAVGTTYKHGPSTTVVTSVRRKADEYTSKIAEIEIKTDPIILRLPLHKTQLVYLKDRKQRDLLGAFVTFEHRTQQRTCLEEYAPYSRRFCCGLFTISACTRMPERLRFTSSDGKTHSLRVTKAPTPRSILWENWNATPLERIKGRCCTAVALLLLFAVVVFFVSLMGGFKGSPTMPLDYAHCDEEIGANYFESYARARSRSRTLARPKNPNKGQHNALETDWDRMCLNYTRQAYDYDNLRPFGDRAYFVSFRTADGHLWLDAPGYRPTIVNRTFEIFTPFGLDTRFFNWMDFRNVSFCRDPCWPGVGKNPNTMCETRACRPPSFIPYEVDDDVENAASSTPARRRLDVRRKIRPCMSFWKGTVPACFCRRTVTESLGLFSFGSFVDFFSTHGGLCGQFSFALTDVGFVNAAVVLAALNACLTYGGAKRIVNAFERPRTVEQRAARVASVIFWGRCMLIATICVVAFDGHKIATDLWPSRSIMADAGLSWIPLFAGPAVGFDVAWYALALPAVLLLVVLMSFEAVSVHICVFVKHRLRWMRERTEAPSQHDLDQLAEGPKIDLVVWMTRIGSTVCIGALLGSGAPVVFPIIAIGLSVTYAMEKTLVLRFYSMRNVWKVSPSLVVQSAHTVRVVAILQLFVAALTFSDDDANFDSRLPSSSDGFYDTLVWSPRDVLGSWMRRKSVVPCVELGILLLAATVVDNLLLSRISDPVDRHLRERRPFIRRATERELEGFYDDAVDMKATSSFSCYNLVAATRDILNTTLSACAAKVRSSKVFPTRVVDDGDKNKKKINDEVDDMSITTKRVLPKSFYLFLTEDLTAKENWPMIRAILPVRKSSIEELENPFSRRMTLVVHEGDIRAFYESQKRRYRSGKHGWTIRGVTDSTRQFVLLRKVWSEDSDIHDVPHRRLHCVKTWEMFWMSGRPPLYNPNYDARYQFCRHSSQAMMTKRKYVDKARDEQVEATFRAVTRQQNEAEASKSEPECDDDDFFEPEYEWEKKAPLWRVQLFRHGLGLRVDDKGKRELRWIDKAAARAGNDQSEERAKREQLERRKAKDELERIEALQKIREERWRTKKESREREERARIAAENKESRRIAALSDDAGAIPAKRPGDDVVSVRYKRKCSVPVTDRKIASLRKRFPLTSEKQILDAMNAARGITVVAMRILRGEDFDVAKEVMDVPIPAVSSSASVTSSTVASKIASSGKRSVSGTKRKIAVRTTTRGAKMNVPSPSTTHVSSCESAMSKRKVVVAKKGRAVMNANGAGGNGARIST